ADSLGHPLAYVRSTNGGKVAGLGPAVGMDPSGLSPGTHGVDVVAQDAYKNAARCTAHFRVLPQPDSVTMACTGVPSAVEPGQEVNLVAQATDALGHPLRFFW